MRTSPTLARLARCQGMRAPCPPVPGSSRSPGRTRPSPAPPWEPPGSGADGGPSPVGPSPDCAAGALPPGARPAHSATGPQPAPRTSKATSQGARHRRKGRGAWKPATRQGADPVITVRCPAEAAGFDGGGPVGGGGTLVLLRRRWEDAGPNPACTARRRRPRRRGRQARLFFSAVRRSSSRFFRERDASMPTAARTPSTT